ncbi:hypothetical protein, partial [Pseudomonas aeruginosa]
ANWRLAAIAREERWRRRNAVCRQMRAVPESAHIVQPGSAMDREATFTFLLRRLRGRLFQRLLVAVMLATMLPVATASLICQV